MGFKLSIFLTMICVILFCDQSVLAFRPSSGRSVGMGGAYTQIARGVESAFWNPANLGFSKKSQKNLLLFSLGANAYNNSLTLEQYNQYNGEFLTSEDKQTILNLIPSQGFNLSIDAEVSALGISWGNWAFTVSGRGTSDLLLPKDPIQTLFLGNEINDTILLNGSQGEAFASVDFGLSYGESIWRKDKREILCGINARYIRGLVYQKIIEAQGEVLTLETGVNGEGAFILRSAEGGKGYGLDLGLALKYNEKWTFGLSLINLISQIHWDEKTESKRYRVEIDSVMAEDFDVDSLVIEDSYTEVIDAFTTRIPATVSVGASYQGKRSLLSFDVKQGFKEGMGVTTKLTASIGAEYRILSSLDVRGGISMGEDEGVTIANGLGIKLGTYYLDVGLAMQNGLWPTKSKGICIAISNGFIF